ncbi:2601_t:CDS:2 [Paraglomus occultum]|uniref:2601_t:CDS:1 n=1 Tax=Paraglomus occultum TaxID=144539 RepID=A0A9N9C9I3_9GLOM|nr:2601_t:CDS:2 [Paraglomus occultum]
MLLSLLLTEKKTELGKPPNSYSFGDMWSGDHKVPNSSSIVTQRLPLASDNGKKQSMSAPVLANYYPLFNRFESSMLEYSKSMVMLKSPYRTFSPNRFGNNPNDLLDCIDLDD